MIVVFGQMRTDCSVELSSVCPHLHPVVFVDPSPVGSTHPSGIHSGGPSPVFRRRGRQIECLRAQTAFSDANMWSSGCGSWRPLRLPMKMLWVLQCSFLKVFCGGDRIFHDDACQQLWVLKTMRQCSRLTNVCASNSCRGKGQASLCIHSNVDLGVARA